MMCDECHGKFNSNLEIWLDSNRLEFLLNVLVDCDWITFLCLDDVLKRCDWLSIDVLVVS